MSVSVIIPALNEASVIGRTIHELKKQNPHEIIVSDGASSDPTVQLARDGGAKVVSNTVRGRALQMNEGARAATGKVLLFLHADTLLPRGGLELAARSCEAPGVVGGRFRVRFDDPALRYRWMAFYTRYPFFSYGDQAFFVRKEVFRAMGGFDPAVPFEDIDFFKRLRQRGNAVILKSAVTTSARRFQKTGFFKQKIINAALGSLVIIGWTPSGLVKRWYPDVR